MSAEQYAVLASGVLYRVMNNNWIIEPVQCDMELSSICAIAESQKIANLWVLDDIDCGVEYYARSVEEWNTWQNYNYPLDKRVPFNKKHQLVSVVGFRRSDTKSDFRFSIAFPLKSKSPWRFLSCGDTKNILLTILYLDKALGVKLSSGASTVGMNLLNDVARKDWLGVYDFSSLPFKWGDTAHDLIDCFNLLPQFLTGKYLHKIDKNGAYLSAAHDIMCGVGKPVEVSSMLDREKRVGVWLLSNGEWVHTPMLNYMLKSGKYPGVRVVRGYVWEESHGLLKQWARKLWDTRQNFKAGTEWKNKEVRRLAEDAVKQISVATIGLTSYRKFEEDTYKSRPDIKHHIVSHTCAMMHYNVDKLVNSGVRVVMVYMDAIYILSDEEDIFKACAPLLTKERVNILGGYKPEWTIDTNEGVFDILKSDTAVSFKLAKINEIVKNK